MKGSLGDRIMISTWQGPVLRSKTIPVSRFKPSNPAGFSGYFLGFGSLGFLISCPYIYFSTISDCHWVDGRTKDRTIQTIRIFASDLQSPILFRLCSCIACEVSRICEKPRHAEQPSCQAKRLSMSGYSQMPRGSCAMLTSCHTVY